MDESKKRILNEPDYINLKRFDYSLAKLMERYPDGAPDKVIASALMMTEVDVDELYEDVVQKLRALIGA